VPLDQVKQLSDLVGFHLALDFLKVEQLRDVGMGEDVMTFYKSGRAPYSKRSWVKIRQIGTLSVERIRKKLRRVSRGSPPGGWLPGGLDGGHGCHIEKPLTA